MLYAYAPFPCAGSVCVLSCDSWMGREMTVCADCGYPFEGECHNPACVRVNPEAHAKHKAEADKRQAEQDERNRVREWAAKQGYSAI